MLPSRFIVATDGSEAAEAACVLAADMAQVVKPDVVILLSVVRVGVGAPDTTPTVLSADDEHVKRHAEILKRAEDCVREIITDQGVQVETKLLTSSSPADAIIAEARTEDGGNHVFVGSRGRGGFAGMVLGSVSHSVVQFATCPVTVVRT